MLKKPLLLASIIAISVQMQAQMPNDGTHLDTTVNPATEISDSLHTGIHAPENTAPATADLQDYEQEIYRLNAVYRAMQHSTVNRTENNFGDFLISPLTPGVIASWGSGGIIGNTGMESMPGLMGKESGRITLVQHFGRFSVTAYGSAEKYGYYNGLDRTVGFGGSISYRASDRVSITMFGSYYSPLRSPQGAVAGYVSVPRIGGYIDYSFNEHWGVEVGAQSYRSSHNGHWNTQPIVAPYYRINKHTKIGMDVGGILYNILYNNNRGGNRHNRSNPTIPIPRMGTLPVGSRD